MKTWGKRLLLFLVSTALLLGISACSQPASTQEQAGSGITGATVNTSGHLVLTLANGQTIDAGNVVGPKGPAGASGFAELVPVVEPSIVRIDVTIRNGLSSGSGTLVDKRGYIMTNNHVITGGQAIKVTLKDNTTLTATVVAADGNQDLAILKLDSPRTDFPAISLGTMADVRVGAPVMAMGFPAGTSLPGPATFTAGIVSAIRSFGGGTYIQTDTPVNPGNSGGCLLTADGKMVGIPSEGITPANQDFEDINLAIPIDQVTAFINAHVK